MPRGLIWPAAVRPRVRVCTYACAPQDDVGQVVVLTTAALEQQIIHAERVFFFLVDHPRQVGCVCAGVRVRVCMGRGDEEGQPVAPRMDACVGVQGEALRCPAMPVPRMGACVQAVVVHSVAMTTKGRVQACWKCSAVSAASCCVGCRVPVRCTAPQYLHVPASLHSAAPNRRSHTA